MKKAFAFFEQVDPLMVQGSILLLILISHWVVDWSFATSLLLILAFLSLTRIEKLLSQAAKIILTKNKKIQSMDEKIRMLTDHIGVPASTTVLDPNTVVPVLNGMFVPELNNCWFYLVVVDPEKPPVLVGSTEVIEADSFVTTHLKVVEGADGARHVITMHIHPRVERWMDALSQN